MSTLVDVTTSYVCHKRFITSDTGATVGPMTVGTDSVDPTVGKSICRKPRVIALVNIQTPPVGSFPHTLVTIIAVSIRLTTIGVMTTSSYWSTSPLTTLVTIVIAVDSGKGGMLIQGEMLFVGAPSLTNVICSGCFTFIVGVTWTFSWSTWSVRSTSPLATIISFIQGTFIQELECQTPLILT